MIRDLDHTPAREAGTPGTSDGDEGKDEPDEEQNPDDDGASEPDDGLGAGAGIGHEPSGGATDGARPGAANREERPSSGGRQPGAASSGSRPFISYIGTHYDGDGNEHDPDGLDREARMKLEAQAIDLVLSQEPCLKRTPLNNAGFDLYEPGSDDRPVQWVEVKAMTGSLDDRHVCMSRAQFDCAWVNGEDYWLYIVEHAGDRDKARVLRIRTPQARPATTRLIAAGDWQTKVSRARRRTNGHSMSSLLRLCLNRVTVRWGATNAC